MNSITVTTETTPNPETLKFKFSQKLLDRGIEFSDVQSAIQSPLAMKLFGFPWTSQVYLGEDFVSITKQDWVDWSFLAQPLNELIFDHINGGEPLYTWSTESEDPSGEWPSLEIADLVRKVKLTLQNEIRPVVALDGGDVVFDDFNDGILYLKMRGACASCPSKSTTLKSGIEVRLKELYPEIKEVIG